VNYTPELTLLLTGENLNGSRVESATRGISVAGSTSSANVHYLFVHLRLNAKLRAGNAELRLKTTGGSITINLPLKNRADSRGRFESFSRDDVIYLIMPDRFADGDPANARRRSRSSPTNPGRNPPPDPAPPALPSSCLELPRTFFNAMCSAINSARTSSLVCRLLHFLCARVGNPGMIPDEKEWTSRQSKVRN